MVVKRSSDIPGEPVGEMEKRQIAVQIPSNVKTGTKVRLKGQGEPGQGGGFPGDIYIHITVNVE